MSLARYLCATQQAGNALRPSLCMLTTLVRLTVKREVQMCYMNPESLSTTLCSAPT